METSLDELANDTSRAQALPRATIAALILKTTALQSALAGALLNGEAPASASNDELLTIDEAAKLLRVDPPWIYGHWKKLGIGVQVGAATLRYSRAEVLRVIRERTVKVTRKRPGVKVS